MGGWGATRDSAVKSLSVSAGDSVWSPGQKDPQEKETATTLVLLPGESMDGSLAGAVHKVAETWTELSDQTPAPPEEGSSWQPMLEPFQPSVF